MAWYGAARVLRLAPLQRPRPQRGHRLVKAVSLPQGRRSWPRSPPRASAREHCFPPLSRFSRRIGRRWRRPPGDRPPGNWEDELLPATRHDRPPVWTVRTRTPCGAPDDRKDPSAGRRSGRHVRPAGAPTGSGREIRRALRRLDDWLDDGRLLDDQLPGPARPFGAADLAAVTDSLTRTAPPAAELERPTPTARRLAAASISPNTRRPPARRPEPRRLPRGPPASPATATTPRPFGAADLAGRPRHLPSSAPARPRLRDGVRSSRRRARLVSTP